MKSQPEKFSWTRTSDLLQRFFLLLRMLGFCFLHLNLSQCPFSKNGDMLEDHQVSPHDRLGAMLCKTLLSRISLPIDEGKRIYLQWFTAMILSIVNKVPLQLNNFFSLKKWLKFLLEVNSAERISYRLKNHRNDCWDQRV